MAIHIVFIKINDKFSNGFTHIFTNYLNGLYVIKMPIKHFTLYNNHSNKTILKEIVVLLRQRIQPTTLYKVCAHSDIKKNEKIHKFAKTKKQRKMTL